MSVCSKFFISIKQYFKNPIADIKSNMPIVVQCSPIDERFEEYGIKTTHKEIMGLCDKLINELEQEHDEKWKKDQNITGSFSKISHRKIMENTFNKIYQNVIKYSDKELNNLYERQNKKWGNWCDDVVLYYCYNRVLNQKLIPIISL
jgi:hypothetical protein